jgi:hypothetical protein
MNAENITTYTNEETGYLQINQQNPEQNRIRARIDHVIRLHERMKLRTGFQGRLHFMRNKGQEEFSYSEQTYGGYGSLSYNSSKLQLTAGLRFEHYTTGADNGSKYSDVSLLPEGSVNFKTGAASGTTVVLQARNNLSGHLSAEPGQTVRRSLYCKFRQPRTATRLQEQPVDGIFRETRKQTPYFPAFL